MHFTKRTCDPLVTDQDAQNFFEIMADNFAGEVQYNNLVCIK